MNFDVRGAISNWSHYADEISIAVNRCPDTIKIIEEIGNPKVKIIETDIDFDTEPLAYGKILDSALQACTGDLLIQQDADERFRVNKDLLPKLHKRLKDNFAASFFIPTIDLYGDKESYVNISRKWYCHLPGYKRGPVNFGFKENGRIDYNKSSSDELVNQNGDLLPTINLFSGNGIEDLQIYVNQGLPVSYHLGFLNLTDRCERAAWWSEFWTRATGGDKNNHITDINELLKRETKKHNLPLWIE